MCTNLSYLLRYVNMEQRPVFTFLTSLVNVAQTRDLIHVQIWPKQKLTWNAFQTKMRFSKLTIFLLFSIENGDIPRRLYRIHCKSYILNNNQTGSVTNAYNWTAQFSIQYKVCLTVLLSPIGCRNSASCSVAK